MQWVDASLRGKGGGTRYLLQQVLAHTGAGQDSRGIKLQLRELALAFQTDRSMVAVSRSARFKGAHGSGGARPTYESTRVVVVDGLGVSKRLEHNVDVQHTGLHRRLLLAIQKRQISTAGMPDADPRAAMSTGATGRTRFPRSILTCR